MTEQTMKTNEEYLNLIHQLYFDEEAINNDWDLKKPLVSISSLSQIFNSYIDYAEQTENFKNFDNPESDKLKEFFLMNLAHNLLFTYKILKELNIPFEELLDKHIMHEKQHSAINSHMIYLQQRSSSEPISSELNI